MAYKARWDTAMKIVFDNYARGIHTNIKARVVGVDYSVPSIEVQPLGETNFGDGTVDSYPVIFEVPLSLPSGNGGKSRLAIPPKPGDIVGLSFSERNIHDSSDTTTHGLFAGWAVSEIFDDSNSLPIHPDNVELQNDKVKFSMSPEGDYILETPTSTMKVLKDGTFEFSNGAVTIAGRPDGTGTLSNASGGINLKANGETDVNGGTITRDGNFITGKGANLDTLNAWFLRHTHPDTHGGDTGKPNP